MVILLRFQGYISHDRYDRKFRIKFIKFVNDLLNVYRAKRYRLLKRFCEIVYKSYLLIEVMLNVTKMIATIYARYQTAMPPERKIRRYSLSAIIKHEREEK